MSRIKYEIATGPDPATVKQMFVVKMVLWTAWKVRHGDWSELMALDRSIVDSEISIKELRRIFKHNGHDFLWIDSDVSATELAEHLEGVLEAVLSELMP